MDPDWHEESVIFELYNQRIPINEFMSLMSSDNEWSHMANKKQMEQVMTLFNKVYGFAKGLSRREEQQKRYQKKIKDL